MCIRDSDILILEPETGPPAAFILSIDPPQAVQGETVRFQGEGVPAKAARITEYEWTSSIQGLLSRRASFETDDLEAGEHTIRFRVRDSMGRWSSPATSVLKVTPFTAERPWVTIDPFPTDGPLSAPLLVTGKAGPFGQVEVVEVRVGSNEWRPAWGTSEWEYLLDIHELGLDGRYSLQVRSIAGGKQSAIVERIFEVSLPDNEDEIDVPVVRYGRGFDRSIQLAIVISCGLLALIVLSVIIIKGTLGRRYRL